MRPTLVIMLKEPRPGRVKTRLGADIGMTNAAWWFRHQAANLIRKVSDARWDVVLAVSPDREGLASRVWPQNLHRMAQGQGDLGDRMARMLRAQGPSPVCLIGADIPAISSRHIARAFELLRSADAVFGPAPDGGYWLIGLKHPYHAPPRMFENVRWSSEHALEDTLATLGRLRVVFADTLSDVDTADDLRMTTGGARAT